MTEKETTAMDMIKDIVESMEKSGVPDEFVTAFAGGMIDILNMRVWADLESQKGRKA